MNTLSQEIEPLQGDIISGQFNGEKRRVLVCAGRYLPGFKSGGPIRSIANMITHLSPYFDFYVLTRDRDNSDEASYPGITAGKWYRVGRAHVLYSGNIGAAVLRRAFREAKPDLIHVDSFQDVMTRCAVLLRRRGEFAETPLLLAPRGEFSPAAMKIKAAKKSVYRYLTRLLGVHDELHWHVSTPREKADLLAAAPARKLDPDNIHIAYNISDATPSQDPHPEKIAGSMRLAFIARISEMKNLQFLLGILREVRGDVQLNLYGPIGDGDRTYWQKCQTMLAVLPANIRVAYLGSLEHTDVPRVLHGHHFFILPTKGENFCHSAVESFVHGTPVILSDQTPWLNLAESHAGFDLPLSDRDGWVNALHQCIDMDQQTYAEYLTGAAEFGRRFSIEAAVLQHRNMFEATIQSSIR